MGTSAWHRAEPASTVSVEEILRLRPYLRIVHHVHGRIRVRLSAAALGTAHRGHLAAFRRFIENLDGVRHLRLSEATLSAVVDYDRRGLPPELWDRLIDGPDEAVRSAFEALTCPARRSGTAHP